MKMNRFQLARNEQGILLRWPVDEENDIVACFSPEEMRAWCQKILVECDAYEKEHPRAKA